MSLPKKFCSAPFKTAVIDRDGAMLPCCEYMPSGPRESLTKIKDVKHWWNIELQDLRQDMIDGKPNSGCHHCIAKESNPNSPSHRQYTNSHYPKLDFSVELDAIEIRVSNYCNLKCIMCGSYASSSIADEYKKHESKYNSIGMVGAWEPTNRWWDDQTSLDNLKSILTTVSRIHFAGGEPLLLPEVTDILNSLDPSKIKEISFSTNLTRLTDKFLNAIKNFKLVKIQVSLEGHGEHNDYIRNGSDWTTINSNINKLLEYPNVILTITHVLQHTSIFALPKLLKYHAELNAKKTVDLYLNEIYHGSYPSPGVLTVNSALPIHVNRFVAWLEEYRGHHQAQLTNWIKKYEFDASLHQKFNEYINMLDGIRGNSFANTFQINT
jgi:radical SAM protein with 4Fe4S-binding SPASM domain